MIVQRTGTEVRFKAPLKKIYQIESSDVVFSTKLALTTAKNHYPNIDWTNPVFSTNPYTYNDIIW